MVNSKIKEVFKGIGSILCGVGVGVMLSNFVICRVTVEGVSMNPTYYTGDVLFVNRLSEPKRGDIVTFERNNKSYIKRIIALPGDTILIDNSKVYVNGEVISEDYINEEVFEGGNYEDNEYTLKEDEYFVMGDNRNYSLDSRKFGVVYKNEIIGTKLIDLG